MRRPMLMETIFLFIFVIFTTTVVLCQNPFAKGFSQQMLKNIKNNGINNNINDNSINLGRYLASQRDRFLEKMKQEQQNMMKDFNLGSDGGSLQSFSIAGRGGQLRSPHLPRRQQQQACTLIMLGMHSHTGRNLLPCTHTLVETYCHALTHW